MNAAAAVGHGRELLDIEVDGAAQILVAHGVLRADAGDVDGNIDGAVGHVFGDVDGARDFVEAAAHQSDNMMACAEVGEAVVRIDDVGS